MLSPKDLLTHIPLLLFPILILIIIGIVVFVLMRLLHLPSEWKGGELPTVTSVVRRQILTANEMAFFRSLHTAVGEQYSRCSRMRCFESSPTTRPPR